MTERSARFWAPGFHPRRILILWAVWSTVVLTAATVIERLPPPSADLWNGTLRAPPLARWDSGWYRTIADFGYRFDPQKQQNNVTFYPLYPVMVGALARLLGTPLFWTGIVFSLLSLLLALLLFADLAAQWGGRTSATASVGALLLWPTSFYLAAFYTEALFLLTTVLALWAARRRSWALAGVAGLLAALTRLNGFLILVPIGWYAWRATAPGSRWKTAPGLVGPIAGAALFPAYLWWRWHDPLLVIHSKTMGWNQRLSPIWTLVSNASNAVAARSHQIGRLDNLVVLLEILSVPLFAVLTVALFRMRLIAEGLYCGVTMLLLLHGGAVDGIDRYVLVLFPGFFALGGFLRTRPWLARVSALLAAVYGVALLYGFVRWTAVS